MKIKISIFIILYLFLINTGRSCAEFNDVQKYYEDLFNKVGFEISSLSNKNDIPTIETQFQESDVNKDIYINTKQGIRFVITENDYSERRGEYEPVSLGFIEKENTNAYMFYKKIPGSEIEELVINEKYLYTPEYIEKTIIYLKEYLKKYTYTEINDFSNEISSTDTVVSSSALEFFYYMFFVLLFSTIFVIPLYSLRNNNISDIKTNTHKYLDSINIALEKLKPIVLVTLTLIFFMLIGYYFILRTFFPDIINSNFINIFLDLDYFKIRGMLVMQTKWSFAIITVFFIIIFLICILALPSLIKITNKSITVFKEQIFKKSFINFIVIFLLIIFILSLPFIDINNFTVTLMSLVGLLLIFAKMFVNKANTISFSMKGMAVSFALCTIATIISLYIITGTKRNNIYITDILFNTTEDLVLFPYKQTLISGTNSVIQERPISGNYPIFADNYLLYHPKYSRIENSNLSELTENNSNMFIVISNNNINNLKKFLRYPNTIQYFRSANNDTVYFDYPIDSSNLLLNLSIDCSIDRPKTNVSVNIVGDNYEILNSTVFFFPGCKTSSIETFSIPITENLISGKTLLQLINVEKAGISNMELKMESSESTEKKYFNSKIRVVENIKKPYLKTINNYSFSDIKKVDFVNNISDFIDISDNVNILLDLNGLHDNFLFWSNISHAYIRNNEQVE